MLAVDHTVAALEPISHTLHVLAVELAMHERSGRRHAMMPYGRFAWGAICHGTDFAEYFRAPQSKSVGKRH